ncbi:MAG: flagellar basal body rod protein FlgC [Comamonadaceae bacterium]|nr:MAG: flagellar basal body rod protein FlgC [Comamonadaceae bacterium]
MDYTRAFGVSAAGMALERSRVDIAAANLAQATTALDPAGVAIQPQRVVARVASAPPFGHLIDGLHPAPAAASVTVEAQGVAPRRVHEPGHPFADPQGFVAYPGVDPAAEMVTLMAAMRSYEANLAALNTARMLALRTLDIGRGS